jgi:C-terminal processing protease CtpA/Prc
VSLLKRLVIFLYGTQAMKDIKESIVCSLSKTENNEVELTIFDKGIAHDFILTKVRAEILAEALSQHIQLWNK